jgi:hypothetical protein
MKNDWNNFLPYRCAVVCLFGIVNDLADPGTYRCRHPAHPVNGFPIPLNDARAPGAVCGPEAGLLTFRDGTTPAQR